MMRHLTVSAIILHEDSVLLIDHRKASMMLPPGGHIEPGEDPVGTVVREVQEEVGLDVEIIADAHFEHPLARTLAPPFTINVIDNVTDPAVGPHTHIDLVYVCRPLTHRVTTRAQEIGGHMWVPYARIAQLNTPPELPALVVAADNYARRVSACRCDALTGCG